MKQDVFQLVLLVIFLQIAFVNHVLHHVHHALEHQQIVLRVLENIFTNLNVKSHVLLAFIVIILVMLAKNVHQIVQHV